MPNIRVPLGGFAVMLSLALVLVSCDDSSGGPATGPAPAAEAAPQVVVLSQGREVLRFYGDAGPGGQRPGPHLSPGWTGPIGTCRSSSASA